MLFISFFTFPILTPSFASVFKPSFDAAQRRKEPFAKFEARRVSGCPPIGVKGQLHKSKFKYVNKKYPSCPTPTHSRHEWVQGRCSYVSVIAFTRFGIDFVRLTRAGVPRTQKLGSPSAEQKFEGFSLFSLEWVKIKICMLCL